MEKMISITLSGVLFNIEEDAFGELNNYLESLRQHYGGEEREEILADIESSIAEKFSELIKGKKKIITRDDVRGVIKVMGTVEEIDAEKSDNSQADSTENVNEDRKEKIFSLGKRLYRNPEDVVIAGVCSGIASYFGIDPVIVRIIFALLVFVNGIGVLAYIILWIVMPEAQTNVQKLEMQGEPVNVKKLEETIKEKAAAAKNEGQNALNRIKTKRGALYKIINFPFVICRAVFQFLLKILKMFLPLMRISLGVIFVVASLAAILGLTVFSGVMIFDINSPYLVSDIPLNILTSSPLYYVGVLGVYFLALIPLVFLAILGITMLRRKNSFRLLSSGVLVAVWIISIAAFAVAAGDLAPKIISAVREEEKIENITRDYNYADFNKLYLGGQIKAEIKPGNNFSIKMTGREKDLDRLQFNIEDGQLQITEKRREEAGKICIFCFEHDIQAEITVPDLKSLVTINRAAVELENFDNLEKLSVGESSNITAKTQGQDLEVYIAGVNGRLNLIGSPKNLEATLEGYGRLDASELQAETVKIKQNAISRAYLGGEANNLIAEVGGAASLFAQELKVKKVQAKADNNGSIRVNALESLEAIAKGAGKIYYLGSPELSIKKFENGRIQEMADANFGDESDNEDGSDIKIVFDNDTYSPFMSSIRGIGLDPSFDSNEFKYYWSVTGGQLVDSWDNPIYVQSLTNNGGKIYWTILDDKASDTQPIYINLRVKDENNEIVSEDELQLKKMADGIYQIVK